MRVCALKRRKHGTIGYKTYSFLSPFSASTSWKEDRAFMTGLRYSPLHVTELCGEMQGNFKVGYARLIRTDRAVARKKSVTEAISMRNVRG